MSTSASTPLTGASLLSSLGLSSGATTTPTASSSSTLGEQDFLNLMTTQLQDQDPLNPVSNSDFFSQIAQFSEVSGINQLNTNFTQLSSQLTSSQSSQAASLIGHNVLVSGSVVQLGTSAVTGAVDAASSGDVVVQVRSASGALVRTLDLGQQAAGQVPFTWDGKDGSGNVQAPGAYSVSAQIINGTTAQAASTDVTSQITSVSLGSSGLTLNLANGSSVPFSSVIQLS